MGPSFGCSRWRSFKQGAKLRLEVAANVRYQLSSRGHTNPFASAALGVTSDFAANRQVFLVNYRGLQLSFIVEVLFGLRLHVSQRG